MRQVVCALTFALFSPYTLFADPSSYLDPLPGPLEAGQLVILVDANGAEIPAAFEALTPSGLEYRAVTRLGDSLRISGTLDTIQADSVVSVVRFDRGNPGEEIYRRRGTFGALGQRLKLDMLAGVLETSGTRTIGKVTAVSPQSLVVDGRTFSPPGVKSIEKPSHLWDGALKGAAVALGTTLILVASTCHYGCSGVAPFVVIDT